MDEQIKSYNIQIVLKDNSTLRFDGVKNHYYKDQILVIEHKYTVEFPILNIQYIKKFED